jgi:hypothetical protein
MPRAVKTQYSSTALVSTAGKAVQIVIRKTGLPEGRLNTWNTCQEIKNKAFTDAASIDGRHER